MVVQVNYYTSTDRRAMRVVGPCIDVNSRYCLMEMHAWLDLHGPQPSR